MEGKIPVVRYCKVISITDDTDADRIKVRFNNKRYFDGSREEPDWKGRCSCLAILGLAAIVSKSFLEASLGWLVINRMRKSPGISTIFASKSAKSTP